MDLLGEGFGRFEACERVGVKGVSEGGSGRGVYLCGQW
jgi:hypothetical protein